MEHVRMDASGHPPGIVPWREVDAVPFRGEAVALGRDHPLGDAVPEGA